MECLVNNKKTTMTINNDLKEKGLSVIEGFLNSELIESLIHAIDNTYKKQSIMKKNKNLDSLINGTLHHLILFDDIFMDLINLFGDGYIDKAMHSYFSGKYILQSCGGVINRAGVESYVNNIHRDVKMFTENALMLNILVMLDDFTLNNGATYVLEKSHKIENKPTESDFYARSTRLVHKKGTIVIFNSNIWHAAAENRTKYPRRAITLTYSKPFIKQQLDYCRAIGYEKVQESAEYLKQVLGFNSRVPTNLEEWYQPIDKRFYKNE